MSRQECSLLSLSRSLRKEPKYSLRDRAMVADQGGRYENMVAGHLLKAVHLRTDLGPGEFELFFLRTKDRREVDFLVTKDSKAWFPVEMKSSDAKLSRHPAYFQEMTGADHAFKVTIDAPFVDADCFAVSLSCQGSGKDFSFTACLNRSALGAASTVSLDCFLRVERP